MTTVDSASLYRVTCFILAGGVGERLRPLTSDTPKPLLSFGGAHRLIDITLSNVMNSRLERAYVLTEYLKADIGRRLRTRWARSGADQTQFVHQPATSGKRYRGTADAVAQNLQSVPFDSDLILVLASDHVYRMDYRRLLDFHVRSGAGATVAATPIPLAESRQFGILELGSGRRILRFDEKPPHPRPLPDRPDQALASMGVYVFSRWLLLQALADLGRLEHGRANLDFGRDVLPFLVAAGEAAAYVATDESGEPCYWRDVGSLGAYHQSNLDLLAAAPAFRLDDPAWPVYGAEDSQQRTPDGCLVAGSALLSNHCAVQESIVAPGVSIEDGADVRRAVLLPGARVGRGAVVRNAVIGAYGVVDAETRIGGDAEVAVIPPGHREDVKAFTATTVLRRPGLLIGGPGPIRVEASPVWFEGF